MPGPIVTLVVANALVHGPRTGLATVAGASLGNGVLVAAGALGLTTVLALAAPVFEWIRWAGAGYLVGLGLKAWREALKSAAAAAKRRPEALRRGVFWHGLAVAVTNPKTILFYAAFFPQFGDPDRPAAPQIWAMSVVFVVLATLSDGLYALLAGRLRPWFANRARARHGIAGTLLLGTGIGLALARRS